MKKKKVLGSLGILGILGVLVTSLALNINYFRQNQLKKINVSKDSGVVTKVVDGDTFDLNNGERIRLYGINAPKVSKECLGNEAKERLETLLNGKEVKVEAVEKDNWGREVSLVNLNGILINEIMTEEGYAYFVKSKPSLEILATLEKAQEKAKAAKRGVWSNLCQTDKANCLIKGNSRASNKERIYSLPDCYNYNQIIIKPGTADQWFCTEAEAVRAGFRKSMDCPIQD